MSHKEKAPGDCGAEGSQESQDCTANSTQPDADKAFATLRAVAALQGHELRRTDHADGRPVYFIARWGLVRHFGSLAQVRAFVARIGSRS
ncbi:hypothetical protein QTI24_29170 [Variovorax sp. J22P240]|uniref:hypothetical protein n=1 Tax=Variovorax sp. J22P240 TaxID=3053514 RepID=UPI002578A3E1|nr:hypothetical protein [Variovorax sp. J22P240]MDM0002704.1 hypothetical protein [Variovorax sp. J22P240]